MTALYADLIAENPIRRWRAERKISQPQAAAIFRVSMGTICNWEQGCTQPSGDNAERIEEVIGKGTVVKLAAWKQRIAKRLAA